MNELLILAMSISVSALLMGVGTFYVSHVDRRLKARGMLLFAAGSGVQVVMCLLRHQPETAAVNAGTMAISLWFWWNNGGGDGMKRRLKSWSQSVGWNVSPQGA